MAEQRFKLRTFETIQVSFFFAPCSGSASPYHWTAREFPNYPSHHLPSESEVKLS